MSGRKIHIDIFLVFIYKQQALMAAAVVDEKNKIKQWERNFIDSFKHRKKRYAPINIKHINNSPKNTLSLSLFLLSKICRYTLIHTYMYLIYTPSLGTFSAFSKLNFTHSFICTGVHSGKQPSSDFFLINRFFPLCTHTRSLTHTL